MKRSLITFVVDLVAFVNLMCLIFTGLIIKFILPPGTSGVGRRLHQGAGREHIKTLWSMSRHEWGDIHFYLACLFVILMAIHIILHWTWIKNYCNRLRI